MELDKLKEVLASWIQPETWASEHDADQERYNRALKKAFDKFGSGITFDDFNEAILLAVQEYHPELEIDEELSEFIEDAAQVAEEIAIYLRDTK